MSILINTARIAGMRGIKDLEINLPRVAVLIGMNNAGKTTVLKALQLALGDYSRFLGEEDFHIAADQTRAAEIVTDLRIVPVNAEGVQVLPFDEEWKTKFGDMIKQEAGGQQFVALRTRSKLNDTKGIYETNRSTLDQWPAYAQWRTARVKETKLNGRLDSISFYAIDAQRDLHQELREKGSFVGRVLSSVEYKDADITALEELIAEVNDQAVDKSTHLKGLKGHLDQLNQSFQGNGKAEITPFPKKIRDLSKHFSVHFGDSTSTAFSMEYHGMGTRSWASLLTVKAFADLAIANHAKEVEPFFTIIGAEEPEAHLHPNAQRTLYKQLSEGPGQVIVSTHSPYLAAVADTKNLRSLRRTGDNVKSLQLSGALDPEDQRRLEREVVHSRGEILFAKAIVLCEGETEEQALPIVFEKYFGHAPFTMGVDFVGVGGGGKRYLPFFQFAKDLEVPLFVFSDGETKTVDDLKIHYQSVFGTSVDITNCPHITLLPNTDFEGYLIDHGFKALVEKAIEEIDGPTAIADWKRLQHGRPGKKGTTRDYNSAGGHERALKDIIFVSIGKPKFAPVIATLLGDLAKTALPGKLVELFNKIKAGASI